MKMRNCVFGKCLALLACAGVGASAQAQIITTVVGGPGGGGAATSAALSGPQGMAVDAAGNFYVADAGNNVIRKIDVHGKITTVAGNGTNGYSGDGGAATNAQLNGSGVVAADAAGNLYIVDNHRIRKVDTHGTITTVAGNGAWYEFSGDGGPATDAGLDPAGVAVDAAGNLYISDYNNRRIRKVDAGGTITTVAGNGTAGYSGDGGAATDAGFDPGQVAVDAAGNLYIAGDNRVRKVDAGGTITTVAGNGDGDFCHFYLTCGPDAGAPATSVPLEPAGVFVDASGDLYITDGTANVVRRVDAGGAITLLGGIYRQSDGDDCDALGWNCYFGDGGAATGAELNYPGGVVVDAAGNVYFADAGNNRIRKIDTGGTIMTVAGNGTQSYSGDGGAATKAQLLDPVGVATDAAGNVYIADTDNSVIRKMDTAGVITTVAGIGPGASALFSGGYSGDGGAAASAQLNHPKAVAVDAVGNVYIADTNNGVIRKVDTGGTITTIAGGGTTSPGDGGAATDAQLGHPHGVAVDAAGDVYIADYDNNRVRKVDAGGTITTVAGTGWGAYSGDGGPATSAEIYSPSGVAVDASGNLYIADSGNSRVRKVDASGIITTVAGNGDVGGYGDGGPATSAGFWGLRAVAVDAAGNLYIADGEDCVIRRVDTSGIVTSVAGHLRRYWGFSGDGGLATDATMVEPSGVAVDAAGNLYFSDTGNGRVRKVALIQVFKDGFDQQY